MILEDTTQSTLLKPCLMRVGICDVTVQVTFVMTDWGFTYHTELKLHSDQRTIPDWNNRVQA